MAEYSICQYACLPFKVDEIPPWCWFCWNCCQREKKNNCIKPIPFWRSGFFWIPIGLSIFLTLLANFLIGVVGGHEIGTNNALFQLVLIVVFIVALYLLVRNYHIQKKLREQETALIAHEQAIDATRNEFINKQTTNINTALGALIFTSPSPNPSRAYQIYSDGRNRLRDIYNKFILLGYIKTGANRNVSAVNVKAIVDKAIADRHRDIQAKQLSIQNNLGNITLTHNEPLLSFVINSVLDNAIKFSNQGGQIAITNRANEKMIRVTISDNGRGIDPSKLNQLFKPFSRAESVIDFAYEGMGLSLFLNRLIMNYTGGQIAAAPRPTGGTDVAITTPINITDLNAPSEKK